MPYWGDGADESDYGFGAVGVYVLLIKERMMKDMAGVIDEAFPEQGITASLACLRQIGERFPKCLATHFRRKDFEQARIGFERWYALVADRLPRKRREGILAEANKEFTLFEEKILRREDRVG